MPGQFVAFAFPSPVPAQEPGLRARDMNRSEHARPAAPRSLERAAMWIKSAAAVCALLAATPTLADPSLKVQPDRVFQSNSYFQSTGSKECPDSNQCVVYFPKIDGKDAVIIRRVSCFVTHGSPIGFAVFGVAAKKGEPIDPGVALPFSAGVLIGQARFTAINEEVSLRVPGGTLPTAAILTTAAGGVALQCVISGEPG